MRDDMREDTQRLLFDEPCGEWEQAVNAMPDGTRREVTDELDAVMQRAARLRAYIDARYAAQHDHSSAVRRSNTLVRKLRKLLGYSYPDASHVSF